ncbi:MAG: hypothetical protein NTV01_02250 [Bacteroidia bacterium]|nr:hypothetical protein [Bacteroidia bacterium]
MKKRGRVAVIVVMVKSIRHVIIAMKFPVSGQECIYIMKKPKNEQMLVVVLAGIQSEN